MLYKLLSISLGLILYTSSALAAKYKPEPQVAQPPLSQTSYNSVAPAIQNIPETANYNMRSGDQLEIIVYGHDDISSSSQTSGGAANTSGRNIYIVRPDNKLDFPLIGEIDVSGKSVSQVREELVNRLEEYIKQPRVSINISKWGTTRVYVLGEIKKPGLYELDKSRRILDAIGKAGAYTKDAAKRNIFLIHQNHQGKPIKIDLIKMLREGDMSQNYELQEGDVIYLNDNGRIDFARDILPFISAIYMGTNIKKNVN